MMKGKITASCFALMLVGTGLYAQVNDAQVWENVNVEKVFTPKLTARLIQEGRVTDNFSNFSFNYFDAGVNYKFNKRFHGALAYVWVEKQRLDEVWSAR